MKTAFVTGSAGFIGYHISKKLLENGWRVVGIDAFTDYYDIQLKKNRNQLLQKYKLFSPVEGRIEDTNILKNILDQFEPNILIHLAAQAGVRYSRENPKSYLETNLIGSFNILDLIKERKPEHILIASSSSVYGYTDNMPFNENQKSDFQLSFYGATKKALEAMSHSYSHNYLIPTTLFRFFTVYGPWGRPDMALYKFTSSILSGDEINVYNHGDMIRDFTYIDDLVESIFLLIHKKPSMPVSRDKNYFNDSISEVAPWRVINIGNSKPVQLLKYVEEIERILEKKAKINLTKMEIGDMQSTWASNDLLREITGFTPATSLKDGLENIFLGSKNII